jgi:hypothetical protein
MILRNKFKKNKNLFIVPLLVSMINCYSYEIMLHSKYDTIKTRRITLPPKMWASFDTSGEEDLRKYCGEKPLLLVKFRNNSPIEVWCNED